MNAMKNYTYHLVAVLTVGIWGLTFISTKVLIGHGLSPQEIFLLRFLIAYMGIWLISPRKLFADNWKDEFWMFLGGMTGGSFYFFTETCCKATYIQFFILIFAHHSKPFNMTLSNRKILRTLFRLLAGILYAVCLSACDAKKAPS